MSDVTAQTLDGAATAAAIKDELKSRIAALREKGIVPGLGTVLVGDDPGSRWYVNGKHKDCAEVGISSIRVDLPQTATQEEIEDAVARLNALGSDIAWGADLGGDDETLLAKEYDRPIFVYNYPKQVKAFYMKENPDDPRTVLHDDCLAPEGYGEIIGGSQREDDYDRLLARIKEQNLDPEAYRWYLDLRKYGTFVHSGFGLGIERTVAWICGIPHIREAIAFPRQIHRLYP